jgi:hypothetical protein
VTSANGIANLLNERSIATPREGMWTARSVLNLTARLSRTQAAQASRKLAKGQRRPGLASGAIPSINQGTRDQLARIVAAVAIVLGESQPERRVRVGLWRPVPGRVLPSASERPRGALAPITARLSVAQPFLSGFHRDVDDSPATVNV